jgi:hypothetical protein
MSFIFCHLGNGNSNEMQIAAGYLVGGSSQMGWDAGDLGFHKSNKPANLLLEWHSTCQTCGCEPMPSFLCEKRFDNGVDAE